MPWLLDTNLLSEAAKPAPDARVLSWLDRHAAAGYVSVISVGELWKGVLLLPMNRRGRLHAWLEAMVSNYEDRILPINLPVVRRWGAYLAEQAQVGRKPNSADALLAATALTHQLTIATRNVRDFPGVLTFDPWA